MTEKHITWFWIAVLTVFVLATAGSRWRPHDTRPTLAAIHYVNALRAAR